MSTASCEKRPMSRMGVFERSLWGFLGFTSKAQPWFGSLVSSQVSQVPYGVAPPAQLVVACPEEVTKSLSALRLSLSTTTAEVPPIWFAS